MREVQLEETGKAKVLFHFIKSFEQFVEENDIVAGLDGHVGKALERRFGIQLVQTDAYDPDGVYFVQSYPMIMFLFYFSSVYVMV